MGALRFCWKAQSIDDAPGTVSPCCKADAASSAARPRIGRSHFLNEAFNAAPPCTRSDGLFFVAQLFD
jgi:hypothetical protein